MGSKRIPSYEEKQYIQWLNCLPLRGPLIVDLKKDMKSGLLLCRLLEELFTKFKNREEDNVDSKSSTGIEEKDIAKHNTIFDIKTTNTKKHVKKINLRPHTRITCINNLNIALEFIWSLQPDAHNMPTAEDIFDGKADNIKLIAEIFKLSILRRMNSDLAEIIQFYQKLAHYFHQSDIIPTLFSKNMFWRTFGSGVLFRFALHVLDKDLEPRLDQFFLKPQTEEERLSNIENLLECTAKANIFMPWDAKEFVRASLRNNASQTFLLYSIYAIYLHCKRAFSHASENHTSFNKIHFKDLPTSNQANYDGRSIDGVSFPSANIDRKNLSPSKVHQAILGKSSLYNTKNRKKEKERTKRLLSYQDKESLIGNGSLPSETQRKFAELNEQNDNFLIDGNSEQQLNSTKGKTKRKLFLTAASKTKGPKHVLPSNNSSPSNTQIKETNSMVDSSPDIKIELEGTYKGQFSFDEDDFLETQSQLNFDFDFSFNPQKETERAIFEDLMSFELLLRRHPSAIDHVEVDLLYSKILEGMSDKVD
eukprot:TRINITY_DN3012_c0_g1_i4.p1 TRINITY_DN3012_c0_g1~~TRINITY_DN3012_c0_g1_i4.p1  ORF type:complete len:534 (+),score=155.07 TRINITY_DN3012_c0_g1_i4:55-1656(+)